MSLEFKINSFYSFSDLNNNLNLFKFYPQRTFWFKDDNVYVFKYHHLKYLKVNFELERIIYDKL